MRVVLVLFGATIIDLQVGDDAPDPAQTEPDPPQFGYGMGYTAHTELAGPQVQPLTEGEPYE